MYKIYDEAIFILLSKYPFLGYFIQSCKLTWVSKGPIQTAAVSIDRDANLKLIINKKYFKSLTAKQRAGLLMHEVLHLIYSHLIDVKDIAAKDQKTANHAADLDVNQNIPSEWMREDWLSLELLEKETKIRLEKGLTFEYYFNELMKRQQESKKQNQKEGDEASAENDNNSNKSLKDFLDKLKSMDDHSEWEESDEGSSLSDDQKQMVINEKIKNIDKECKSRGSGDNPKFIQEIIDQAFKKNKVNWKLLLRKIIGNKISFDTSSTRTRPNRMLGLKSLGKKQSQGPKTIFAVDVSGSISDDDYVSAMSEIKHCLKSYPDKAEVVFFESKIVEIKKFSQINKVPERMSKGGTNFDCVIEYANKNRVDLLIILTDGEDRIKSEVPKGYSVLWLMVRESGMRQNLPGQKILIKEG